MSSPTKIKPKLIFGDWYEHYRGIERHSIDLVLTDPPYGILDKHRSWDIPLNLAEFEQSLDHLLKETGLAIIFCNLDLLILLRKSLTLFRQRSYHVWNKPSGMCISPQMPLPNGEFILVFKRTGVRTKDTTWFPKEMLPAKQPYSKNSNILVSPSRRHIKNPISQNTDGKRWVTTVLDAPHKPCMPKCERSSHPSQKPEQLLRALIRGYSNPGDRVIDPFAGSGSTLISAFREGRPSQGYEKNETYFKEACDRIDSAINQLSLFPDSGTLQIFQKTLDTDSSGY